MSIAADHYEKAAAAGHAGALGEKGFGRDLLAYNVVDTMCHVSLIF